MPRCKRVCVCVCLCMSCFYRLFPLSASNGESPVQVGIFAPMRVPASGLPCCHAHAAALQPLYNKAFWGAAACVHNGCVLCWALLRLCIPGRGVFPDNQGLHCHHDNVNPRAGIGCLANTHITHRYSYSCDFICVIKLLFSAPGSELLPTPHAVHQF
jgi:hypothetical protein